MGSTSRAEERDGGTRSGSELEWGTPGPSTSLVVWSHPMSGSQPLATSGVSGSLTL